MLIKNLACSPYHLIDTEGQGHILPALGCLNIDPHPSHAGYYKRAGFLEVTESTDKPVTDDTDPRESLRAEYAQISGVSADKRWSESRLRSKIKSLLEAQK